MHDPKLTEMRTFHGRTGCGSVCDVYVSSSQGGEAVVPACAGEYEGEGGW